MQLVNELLIETVEVGDLEALKVLLENGADVNYEVQDGNTSLMLAAENGRIEIFNILLLYKAHVYHKNQGGFTALTCSIKNKNLIIKTFKEFLKFKNEIMIFKGNCYEKIIYIIKGDDDNWLKKEESVIDSLEYLQNEIKKLNEKNNSNIEIFWQKEVINSLVFDELNYSLLHIAVINDWQKLVTYLINKWPIDVDYKDNSGNSAWNHACLLLQKEIALTIKNYDQLTIENKMFLKDFFSLSSNWNQNQEQEIDKVANETRREIFKYYIPQTEVEIFKDKINLLDSSSIVSQTTIKRDYGSNM
ncbi:MULTISPECIES: ankyrin repeat domain-containing protein [unclassified Spiroplasma]|uniref:ankyrin repeat domain-containing protein n=1 Tax=unclassified Spiroplasma TaxID=2637901 RepID=UPI0030CAF0D2